MQSRLLTIREQWLLLGVAVAVLLGAATILWGSRVQEHAGADVFPADARTPAPNAVPIQPPPARPAEPAPPVERTIGVGAIGAVKAPGVYFFAPGARVQDLIDAAGGTTPAADLSDINRTAPLIDETTLLIPARVYDGRHTFTDPAITNNPRPYTKSSWYRMDQATTPSAIPSDSNATAPARAASTPGRININTASQTDLERLPGIGPVTAARIIAYRQQQRFTRADDLELVSGIGPAKMAALREWVTVE